MHRLTMFDEDYETYKQKIKKQEKEIINYVEEKVNQEHPDLQDLINIMQQLGEILNRPNLKTQVIAMYKKLLQLYLTYMQSIEQFFQQNKERPPIPSGFTPVGGRIAWAKILQLHIERFMNFFKRVYIQY